VPDGTWLWRASNGIRASGSCDATRGRILVERATGARLGELDLDLGTATLSLKIPGLSCDAGWSLEPGLAPARAPDAFRMLRDRVAALIFEQDLASFDAGIAALARRAAEACQPRAREAALPFPVERRLAVYALLRPDTTGRLAQAAAHCAGAILLLLALGARRRRDAPIAGRLHRDLVSGRRLDACLDDALGAWLGDGRRRRARQLPLFEAPRAVLAADAGVASLRLLVRRAGPLVRPETLLRVPPVAPVPEDIPKDPDANAAWFRMFDAAADACRLAPPAYRDAFVGFVSRHAALLEAVERGRNRAGLLRELDDFLRASRRVPGRDTAPLRLVDESRQWHEERYPAPAAARLRAPPEAAAPADAGTYFRIRLLRTPEELTREGEEMAHCVATRLPQVVRGESFIYAAVVKGRRLTVEVVPLPGGGATFGDVRARANDAPTAGELRLLDQWLATGEAPKPPAPRVVSRRLPWARYLQPRDLAALDARPE